MAGVFTGYKGNGSRTAYPMTARDDMFDPNDCTLSLANSYTSWLWLGRDTPSRLRRAWDVMAAEMRAAAAHVFGLFGWASLVDCLDEWVSRFG